MNASILTEIKSYLNSGIEVELTEEHLNQVVTLEIIDKERFVMLKGSFKGEVSDIKYYSEDLRLPKFLLVRNVLGKIIAVRMRTYVQCSGRHVEVFYDEYELC